jgi:altronate dehydratase large subunit
MEIHGYRRQDGSVGIRNHMLIIPSVSCANHVSQQIAHQFEGAIVIPHQHGCSQLGKDIDQTTNILVGMGTNPNVGAVLVVGLGCEVIRASTLAERIAVSGKPVEVVNIQESGGTITAIADGTAKTLKLLEHINTQEREPVTLEKILLATECGGSDTFSGLSANPSVGIAADTFIKSGGSVILSETSEFIGAEHILYKRASTPDVRERIRKIVNSAENLALSMHVDMKEGQPSPGNREGGITSIEEKSLGCIHKGGTTDIVEVVGCAVRPQKSGLVVMDTPSNDVESVTCMLAGGAQIVVFTTGRGSPVGSPISPVIKIASNTPIFERMHENIDLNAGTVIDGAQTIEEMGQQIFETIISVANGSKTRAELLGHREFAINRIGPTV